MTQTTSLYNIHLELGAKMGDFAGFSMPLQYGNGAAKESLSVRNDVGMFDVSHMGEFFVTGKDSVRYVHEMLCNEFINTPIGKAVYSPLCNEKGTIIDDLIAYKLSNEKVLICVNASNRKKDFEWFNKHLTNYDCKLDDRSDDYSLIAIQGPNAQEKLSQFIGSVSDFGKFNVVEINELIVARTGYTGEDGFEVFGSHQEITKLWSSLYEIGVVPCGLVARDILRIEACYPLYGNELDEDHTPFESGLKWTVKLKKDNFVGKSALERTNPSKKLIKLSIEGGVPREGYPILDADGNSIGNVTSGTHSPMLKKGIAMGFIPFEINKEKELFIKIRSRIFKAMKHEKSFLI